MNIKQAKEEIKHSVRAYLAKDVAGEYKIPAIRQRPLLLMGPPGIGKTQIMEQVARECRVGLVSYTITHHTRQSAVGLPFIKEQTFQGTACSVTEYTMSEIIASIYRKMEETGLREGILFIDEINCVSETLAPTMLQFLQCKTFGNQAVPPGWLIAAAGNPPEYNKSVREFDMVTLDRVRTISVEADYKAWREYARTQNIHAALLSYLDLRPQNFYRVEADVDGLKYVTARGWEDFSYLLFAYEEMHLPVTKEITCEFLHHADVAEDVAAYLDLYRKYQDDYGITEILSGKVKSVVYARIYEAGFDERISVVNLLVDGLMNYLSKVSFEKNITDAYFAFLKVYRTKSSEKEGEEPLQKYLRMLKELEQEHARNEKEGFLEKAQIQENRHLLALLKAGQPAENASDMEEAFEQAKTGFDKQRDYLESAEDAAGAALEYAFDFAEEAFGQSEEMVLFVTELTVQKEAASFLTEYTCERYLKYNKQLLIGTRKSELLSELRQR
ncbi:MAG: AAA family ATPase [Eubacterium sp.]|nr:AAA family ATPase [Eubacterium sp.]